MKKYFYSLFILFFSYCTTNKEFEVDANTKLLEINPSTAKHIMLSELFEDVEFIKLETKEDFLISQIEKIEYFNNMYFVLSGGVIFIFDQVGEIVSKIDNKGKGPEEYQTIWDMYIDRDNNTIELLDTPSAKILTYDFEGNLKDIWRHGLIAESFTKADSDKYLFYCGNNFNDKVSQKLVIKSKSNNKILNSFIEIDKKHAKFLHFKNNRRFAHTSKSISIVEVFENVVYKYQNNELSKKYSVDFGKNNISKEFLNQDFDNAMFFAKEARLNEFAFLIHSFFESDDYLFFAYEFGEKVQFVFYNKIKGSILNVKGLSDDLFFYEKNEISEIREFLPLAQSEEKFIIAIEPSTFLDMFNKSNNVTNESPNILNLVKSIEYYENPILLICKPKI
ncbi:6-bladed beta-propeller [Belliella sp. DSM 111904]|uniref:6-bladed beta-propeller n=1 Tax=Belliella filtrata TaxID=2923435 RepID=A0ABS9V1I1_9BACT|nr:6-bladed beta-propeller [Belliella filtrata]MCH7410241.1 6-bladed beta-propeller [Belliella filtrata]